jgi:LuxR family transcriptional regulator, maltose regulon positive regulatory protein
VKHDIGEAEKPRGTRRATPVESVLQGFEVPAQPEGLIQRSRLLERLDLGVAGPLTLVSAPAGTGKTALVSAWASQARGAIAWLTLKAGDESWTAFWTAFTQALGRRGVVVPLPPARTDSKEDHSGYVDAMVSALPERAEPVVVVLDCEADISAAVAEDLDRVLRRSGGWLRLVVVTRVDPVLPLHRYRLAGTVVEVRLADLAFTLPEARELMTSVGAELSDTALQAIHDCTRGWVTGLRFAALSLGRREDRDDQDHAAVEFSGVIGDVAEYLIAEVLDGQPPGGRQFLLETSILDVLRPGLIEAVAGLHGQRVLAFLIRGNAFLDELADDPGCYRYHPLFHELLRAQLAYESPARVPELHRAAASWMAGQGLVEDAVRHCAAAGDWEGAARYLIDDLAVGRLALPGADALPSVLARMPEDTEGAAASLVRAALAMAVFDVETCAENLAGAQAQLDRVRSPHRSAAEFTLQLVRLVHAAAVANVEVGLGAAAAAERLLRLQAPERVAEHPELPVLIQARKGDVWLASGRLNDAAEAFVAGARAGELPGCELLLVDCLGQLALVSAMSGRLRKAGDLAARAIRAQQGSRVAAAACPRAAEVACAWVNTELYDISAARRHAQRAAQAQVAGNDLTPRVMLALVDARVRRARGDVDGALAGIVAARSQEPAPPQWLQDVLRLEEAELDIACGQPELAARTVKGLSEPGSPEGELVLARARMAMGATFQSPATTLRSAAASLPTQVGGWLLEATRQLDRGDQLRAGQALARALRLAAPERLRRPFREASPQVRRLLRGDRRLATEHRWLGAATLDDALPVLQLRRRHEADDRRHPAQSPILEPLTGREREVLGHLAALLTTDEIAGAMFLSVNTVRTHVRNILRKLAASRRNEAVRRARELGIIPDWTTLEPPTAG